MMEMLSLNDSAHRQLSQMLYAAFFFHVSEYLLAIACHGKSKVTTESFLLSKDYIFAMMFSVIEYLIELHYFPKLKEYNSISNLGLFMVIFGETIRKLAILNAKQAFTHVIQRYHEEHHKLITYGIYGIVRHPGYTGFLMWSVGTQIMLCNPVSTVAFAVIAWGFFYSRIPYEEFFLKQFFGKEYDAYMQRVPSGIPFVK